jgi:hypothetical protein
MSSTYERRVEQEWRLLHCLASVNSRLLEIEGRRTEDRNEAFQFIVLQTGALVGDAKQLQVRTTHAIVVSFPSFFPSVPLELTLSSPVFHPNVHPESGFVCLWERFSIRDTVVHAIAQLQRVITWQLFNESPDHLMQPGALAWQGSSARNVVLPLDFEAIRLPEGPERPRLASPSLPRRQRLS